MPGTAVFVKIFQTDPDESMRITALIELGALFRGEADNEILSLSLNAYDDIASSIGLRLSAGAMMMYQFGMDHDEHGRPAWWDENNVDELKHPLILEAVEKTRQLLSTTSS